MTWTVKRKLGLMYRFVQGLYVGIYSTGLWDMSGSRNMVVSQNRGALIQTQNFYYPYDGDPQKGSPNFWETLNPNP